MSTTNSRDELVEAVSLAGRRVSAQGALFTQAVADRLGLASADIECLDVLDQEGRLTVGQLAEQTGLTTGSATRMVDRLEQAGFVRRVPDPADRRRVLVEAVPERLGAVSALHEPLRQGGRELLAGMNEDQLRLVLRFLEQTHQIEREAVARLRAPVREAEPEAEGSYAAPMGGIARGTMVFVSGVPAVVIRGDASLPELYRASFQGSVPKMRVRDGVVTVAYARFGWFDWRAQIADQSIGVSAHWRRDHGEIRLNAAIPWSIELRGGASQLTADLRIVRLTSLEIRGGADKLDLTLSPPAGIVPIRIAGGLSQLTVTRPAGTAVGLETSGSANDVKLDGESLGGSGGLSVQTPGADRAPNRYEIKVGGGAGRISVGTY